MNQAFQRHVMIPLLASQIWMVLVLVLVMVLVLT
jgi:hypothetical protein